MVVLILSDEIRKVGLGFSELHLVHAFSSVPMKEGLPSEHDSELFSDSLEHFLDSSGVTNEGDSHLESLGRNIADSGLDVVGDPFYEVRVVLRFDIEHLLVNFLGGHSSSEYAGSREVSAVSRVGGTHHVLGVEHLLSELGDSEGSVLLGASGCKGGETDHEEVKTDEGDEVDREFPEVGVELTGESEGAGDSGHDGGDEMVEVAVGGGGELEGSEADVVEGFVVNDHNFVGRVDEEMDGESGVVRFDDGVGDLGGGEDREGLDDSVLVLFSDFGDEEGSHAGSSSSSEGVGDLEALEAVAAFSFLSHDVEDGVDQFGSFGVVALGPVVSGSGLAEDEVVGSEELSVGAGSDGVHGSGFQIHEDGSGDVPASGGFVEVDIDSLKFEV